MRADRKPDLRTVFDLLSPKLREAASRAHATLTEAFVRHEAGIVTFHPGLPIGIDGIPVDAVPVPKEAPFLEAALSSAVESEGIPVVAIEALVCMKLLALRPRDRRDIEELVEAGLDVKTVRAFVVENLPELVGELDRIVAK